MRIAFAGWGSWWHVFPVQSLIKYINKKHPWEHRLFRFWEKDWLEEKCCKNLTKHSSNITFVRIISGKRRREKELKALWKNLLDLWKLIIGSKIAFFWLLWNRIDVIFCKWWYVSLPVVIAWWVLRKRIYLHESDTKPGIANRICSKFATTIFTGFPWVFPGKEVVVGQILDDDLLIDVVKHQETEQKKTNVLVTWWSQWAESVYKILKDILSSSAYPNTYFHIILGTKNHHLQMLFSGLQHTKTYDFVDQSKMGELLSLCDVAITRGGTTSLAEQHIFGLKKIIIPIPRTHDQMSNALYYQKKHHDILIDQDSPFFIWELQESIIKTATFQKSASSVDAGVAIALPKDKILQVLFS